jgi:hypothetical protein
MYLKNEVKEGAHCSLDMIKPDCMGSHQMRRLCPFIADYNILPLRE